MLIAITSEIGEKLQAESNKTGISTDDLVNNILNGYFNDEIILEDDPVFEKRTREALERFEEFEYDPNKGMSKEEFLKELESW